jgi:hypothetical protein
LNGWLLNKTTFGRSTVTPPSGYTFNSQLRGITINETEILTVIQKTADSSFWFVNFTESDGNSVPSPTVAVPSNSSITTRTHPVIVNSSVYWVVNTTEDGSTNGRILKTDFNGNQQSLIDCTFGVNTSWAVASGTTRLFYSEANNSIYFLNWPYSYRLDVATEEVEECQIALMIDSGTGLPYPGQQYSGWCQPVDSGEFAYVHSRTAKATTIQVFGKVTIK